MNNELRTMDKTREEGRVKDKTYKIGWFSTGRDEAAGQLLKIIYDNIKKKEIKKSCH